jgi:hypothetical protein
MTPEPIDQAPPPWYRQFWVWLVLAILGWGVVSSTITLSVALRNPPQMMTGDYQRLGKALVDTHARADRAEALGLSGLLGMKPDSWSLAVQAFDPTALPDTLLLLVQHPTDAARDRQLLLRRAADGSYGTGIESVPPRGRIIVSDLEQSWWISASYELASGDGELALKPERL